MYRMRIAASNVVRAHVGCGSWPMAHLICVLSSGSAPVRTSSPLAQSRTPLLAPRAWISSHLPSSRICISSHALLSAARLSCSRMHLRSTSSRPIAKPTPARSVELCARAPAPDYEPRLQVRLRAGSAQNRPQKRGLRVCGAGGAYGSTGSAGGAAAARHAGDCSSATSCGGMPTYWFPTFERPASRIGD